jgi:hypothetical protein
LFVARLSSRLSRHTRLPTHKASDIDALLPHRWQLLSTAA